MYGEVIVVHYHFAVDMPANFEMFMFAFPFYNEEQAGQISCLSVYCFSDYSHLLCPHSSCFCVLIVVAGT